MAGSFPPYVVTAKGGDPAACIIPAAAARREAGTAQQRQLDDLLRRPVPTVVTDAAQYAKLRAWFAVLIAFQRKIRNLQTDVESKRRHTEAEIAQLDAAHPDYRAAFLSNYERGLRESGLSLSSVPFLSFLVTE